MVEPAFKGLQRVEAMGVSGCGKTTVGERLAALGRPFDEGDRFHPEASIARMAAAIPLDADRWPRLDVLAGRTAAKEAARTSSRLSCPSWRSRRRSPASGSSRWLS